MGQSPCTSVRYSGLHPEPFAAAMSVDLTPWRIRSASSVVAATVLKGYGRSSFGAVMSTKAPLLETKLPHDPDGMILHSFGESWQDDQSHVAGAEENGERLYYSWDDTPSYCIICQLFQPFVLLMDSLDGLGVAATAVCLKCMFLGT